MNVTNKPVFNFVISRLILIAVGLLLLAVGIGFFFKQQNNGIFAALLVLLGACVSILGMKGAANVLLGKTLLEQVVILPLPGKAACELKVQNRISRGRVILFFQDTRERYAGTVTLHKVPSAGAPVVSASLPRLAPSRTKIPKWVRTTDAGSTVENWPRRTGQLTDPLVLEFLFPVEKDEKIRIDFELESNFKNTKLEHRFPITGNETVRVVVKK